MDKDINKKNILITTNIPSPYMTAYLEELAKSFNLTVLFEIGTAKDRKAEWYGKLDNSINVVFLNSKRVRTDSGFSLKIIKYLNRKVYDKIIIANPTTPTGIVALLYCRMRKIPFCIQSEGGFQGSGKGIKEHFKKYIMEKADTYLTGMGGDNDYFLIYGATKDRLKPYPFSSLTENDLNKARKMLETGREYFKNKLEMKEKKIIISVGRFSYDRGYGKGYDYLMKLAPILGNDVGIYIIGDEPTDEFLKWKEREHLENVHFVGFKNRDDLAEYYVAADLFILLTREDTWGLVVNEAMAYGLPVITSDKCIAGIELISNGVNGYIVDNEDLDLICEKVNSVLYSQDIADKFGTNSLNKISSYTIENMGRIITTYLK